MKSSFLQKQTSRRENVGGFNQVGGQCSPDTLLFRRVTRRLRRGLRATSASAAELLAYMRAWFNTFPMETQKLADNVTMFDGLDGKFVVDSFVVPGPGSKGLSMAWATLQ
jgi:hypothetical protein